MLDSLQIEAVRFLRGARDPIYWLCICLGLTAWILPSPDFFLAWYWLLVKAAVEELFFRAGLQESMAHILRERQRSKRLWPSRSNLATSAIFAGLHLLSHSSLWASATFFPSLVFGFIWDRFRSALLVIGLHFAYNWLLFHQLQ